MGKQKSNPNRKFLGRISPILKWYCCYCNLEFDSELEFDKHRCEVAK